MSYKLITGAEVLTNLKEYDKDVKTVYLCSPFLKKEALENVLEVFNRKSKLKIEVITKFDLMDIALGVSDESAYQLLFSERIDNWKIRISIVHNLHTKAILIDKKTVILGSANITNSAFSRNEELGLSIQEDKLIQEVQKKLNGYIKNGYELTEQRFNWHKEKHLKDIGEKVINLKKLINDIIERYAGLQSFGLTINEQDYNYFDGLIYILDFIKADKTRKIVLNHLIKSAPRGGESISESRLDLLNHLGLIYINAEKVQLTKLGKTHLKNKDKLDFYLLLKKFYPEFQKLKEFIGRKKKPIHPDDLGESQNIIGQAGFWALRLRWLESLDIANSKMVGNKKFYDVNKAKL